MKVLVISITVTTWLGSWYDRVGEEARGNAARLQGFRVLTVAILYFVLRNKSSVGSYSCSEESCC